VSRENSDNSDARQSAERERKRPAAGDGVGGSITQRLAPMYVWPRRRAAVAIDPVKPPTYSITTSDTAGYAPKDIYI